MNRKKDIIAIIIGWAIFLYLAHFIILKQAFSEEEGEIGVMHSWDIDYLNDLQFTYVVDSKDKQFHQIVDNAIEEWEQKLAPIITFAKTRSIDRGDIYFQQVTTKIMEEMTGINYIGHTETFGETSSGGTTYTNIHILEKLPDKEKYVVTLHELGHGLGLGHSKNIYDLMYSESPLSATAPSRCDVFMVFYANGLDKYLDDADYYQDDEYDNLMDICKDDDDDKRYFDYEYNNYQAKEDNNDDDDYDKEYYYSDGDDWTDFDGDGQLTEYDVDRMCDNNYVEEEYKDEKKCKAMYKEIEEIYGYETEEEEDD